MKRKFSLAWRRMENYFLAFATLLFVMISLVVQSTYPETYSPLYHNISYLGGLTQNPEGALLWNIGMICVGILLIPHQFYLHRHIKKIIPLEKESARNYLKGGLGIRLTACLGFILVAIFPEDLGIWHIIPAFCFFFGFLIAFNLDFGLLRLYSPLLKTRKGIMVWILIGWIDLTFLGLVVTQLFPNILTRWGIPTIALGLSPWEWCLFLSYFGWMGGLHMYLWKREREERRRT